MNKKIENLLDELRYKKEDLYGSVIFRHIDMPSRYIIFANGLIELNDINHLDKKELELCILQLNNME